MTTPADRHAAIGILVDFVLWSCPQEYMPTHRGGENGRWFVTFLDPMQLDALDAISVLLGAAPMKGRE